MSRAGYPRRVAERLAGDRWLLTAVALAGALVVANAAWVWINRRGGALNIDEAGYIALSISDYHVLMSHGPVALARFVGGQPVQAPLVTVLGSPFYVIAGGPSVMASFAVELLAYAWIVIVVFLIVRELADARAGLTAAFLAGSAPVVLDYVHEYSFAVPAAAMLITAAWAAIRSQQMTSLRWAGGWGAALGAMVLTRTMTLAFLPSFLLLALIQPAVSGRPLRSLAGIAGGLVAGLVVAGPWYMAQGASVLGYLTSFGFGEQSTLYGSAASPLSIGAWRGFVLLNVDKYVWLPLLLVIVTGLAILALRCVACSRRLSTARVRDALASPWFYLSFVLLEGIVALESSRNTGSAFPAPLLPVMVALSVGALFRWTSIPSLRAVCVALAVVVGLMTWTAKTAFNGPSGAVLKVDVPGLGQTTLIDGRSEFDIYEGGETAPADPKGARWAAANQRLLTRIRSLSHRAPTVPLVSFATDSRLLNVNTFRLDAALDGGRQFDVTLLGAVPGAAAESYAAQLRAAPGRECFLVLRFSDRGEFAPHVNQQSALQSAKSLGFHEAAWMQLPDSTWLDVWQR